MAYGSGSVAAHRYGATQIVDPRPAARGSLLEAFNRFPWLGPALPAMGYSQSQLDDGAGAATLFVAALKLESIDC